MALLKQFSIYRVVAIGLFSLPFMLYAQGRSKKNRNNNNTHASTINDGKNSASSDQAKYVKGKDAFDYHLVGSPLPPFRAVSVKGEQYTGASLKNNANLFIMMFNPGCEHCEDMTYALTSNMSLFKETNIVLLAAPMQGPYLDAFIRGMKTNDYPRLKIGLDSANFIDRTFNYIALPQINIYSPERILIKSFSGITTIDSLKPYIQ